MDLQHLINGFRGNYEQGFARGGNNGPLVGRIVSLAYEGEFREMVGLREHIHR
jgi:hypothetical protein